jgi:uncharacterized protein
MILRFTIRNWMSFHDEVTLDMVATREEQHRSHILLVPKYNLKVLPIAAIYGANASGKSNLIKALRFATKFITNPPKAGTNIPAEPFLLGTDSQTAPTEFRFELLINETAYRYEFSVNSSRVLREQLIEIRPSSEEVLFARGDQAQKEFTLSEKLAKTNEGLWYAFQGTQGNQLFLSNSVSQKHVEFKPIFDWFDEDLTIISPEMRYGRLPDIAKTGDLYAKQITTWLRDLDSGIHSIGQVDLQPGDAMPKQLFEHISSDLKEGEVFWLADIGGPEGDYLTIENGKAGLRRITPIHRSQTGAEVPFKFTMESDGTRRLLDLLPAFFFLDQSFMESTYAIDELDRSLHSNLTKSLLKRFLEHRKSSSRSQLIFTTHDTELMSQKILRRDEIWITERNDSGASTLSAFSEFKDVRKDKDIRKSYLQGRMGGVPRIKETIDLCGEDEVKAR